MQLQFSLLDDGAEVIAPPPKAKKRPRLVLAATNIEAEPCTSVEVELEPVKPPSLNDIFSGYFALSEAVHAAYRKQRELESVLFGQTLTDNKEPESITKMASAALARLFQKAEATFAPEGGTLKIDREVMLEQLGYGDWRKEYEDQDWRFRHRNKGDYSAPVLKLDLDAIWKHLEQTYGGDAGIRAGYQQQAANLIKEFGIKSDEPIRRTASSVVLPLRIWSEKQDYGQYRGMQQASYNNGDRRVAVFRGLHCFARWAELDDLASKIRPEAHQLADYSCYFKSRDKVTFPGLEIVLFINNWDFKFSHHVAELLMQFLGEFGNC